MPSRTTSWSSTSMTRSGGALMTLSSQGPLGGLKRWGLPCQGASASTPPSCPTAWMAALAMARSVIASPSRSRKSFRVASAAVEQHPVHGPADHAERRAVAGADGQLGPISADQLEVGVQLGEHPVQADRLPGQRQRGRVAG